MNDETFGYTIIDRDGGDLYTSENDYYSYTEAYKAGQLSLGDMNGGSLEVWLWCKSLDDVKETWEA
jgi:hypothetical protein